jgi:hypothetical protein
LEHPGSFFLEEVNEHLGVASSLETVTPPLERGAQVSMIVDLPVEYDGDCSVFVSKGLVPTRNIDDAEPPHPEGNAWGDEESFVVWATVANRVTHAAQVSLTLLRGAGWRPADESCDPAHGLLTV